MLYLSPSVIAYLFDLYRQGVPHFAESLDAVEAAVGPPPYLMYHHDLFMPGKEAYTERIAFLWSFTTPSDTLRLKAALCFGVKNARIHHHWRSEVDVGNRAYAYYGLDPVEWAANFEDGYEYTQRRDHDIHLRRPRLLDQAIYSSSLVDPTHVVLTVRALLEETLA